MRNRICICLVALILGHGHAVAGPSLHDLSRLAGVAAKHMKMLEDGTALTFWMTGLTDDAPRMVSRSELDGPCRIRVTTALQDPPKWGQMQISTYDFSRVTGFKAFASFDDLARQSPSVPLTDSRAHTGSFYGKALYCVNNYDLANDPEIYAYCEDRMDLNWPEDAASREEILKSMAAVADACNLPALKDSL